MIRRSRKRGLTMMELLVSGICSMLVGAAALELMNANYVAHDAINGQNNINTLSRVNIDSLEDSLRNAQAGPLGRVLGSAGSSDITIYTNSSGDNVRYWLDNSVSPAQLKRIRTKSGVASAAQSVGTGLSVLQFTYYTEGGWATTAAPHNPSVAEISRIGAIGISAQMSINGYSRTLNSIVRLRNTTD